jgi:hypothetical protein
MTPRKRRMTVTVDAELVEAANRAVVGGEADSVSAWVSAALTDRARRDQQLARLGDAIADYEAEFGEITAEEIARQRRADRQDACRSRHTQACDQSQNCVTTILDAGALIALDRNDRSMWVRLKGLHLAGERPVTHGGIVGQVWRAGPRQARLATALAGIDVRSLDEPSGVSPAHCWLRPGRLIQSTLRWSLSRPMATTSSRWTAMTLGSSLRPRPYMSS